MDLANLRTRDAVCASKRRIAKSYSLEHLYVKYLFSTLIVAFLSFAAFNVSAQETETKVIDEVVAQVNNDVITLSKVKRETENAIRAAVEQGGDRAAVQKTLNESQGALIAKLINEELMIQKAKEAGIDKDADIEVNQRFAQLMKANGIKSMDELRKQMEKTDVTLEAVRDMWRKQAIIDIVMQREVQSKIYWKPTPGEVKIYFEKNKAKFTKPETVTLSEIFLAFAGRNEAEVREKAKKLVTQLRAGADFEKIVVENSDRPDAATTKGKVDTFPLAQLNTKFVAAIKGLKKGDVTDPIDLEDVGLNILRIDERTQASADSFFDEKAVRMAMLEENLPAGQKEFMTKLREDAYIKISDTYRPLVAPILFEEERKGKTAVK